LAKKEGAKSNRLREKKRNTSQNKKLEEGQPVPRPTSSPKERIKRDSEGGRLETLEQDGGGGRRWGTTGHDQSPKKETRKSKYKGWIGWNTRKPNRGGRLRKRHQTSNMKRRHIVTIFGMKKSRVRVQKITLSGPCKVSGTAEKRRVRSRGRKMTCRKRAWRTNHL